MKSLFACFSKGNMERKREGPLRRKMVIVGDGECGKTCLVTRMSTGNFVDIGYIPTVFETEVVSVHTGTEDVEMVIFDTAGQEDYDRLRPFSYSDVDVVLICFSLADQDTLTNVVENWLPEIRYFCGDVPVMSLSFSWGTKKIFAPQRALLLPPKVPSTPSPLKLKLKLPASECRKLHR